MKTTVQLCFYFLTGALMIALAACSMPAGQAVSTGSVQEPGVAVTAGQTPAALTPIHPIPAEQTSTVPAPTTTATPMATSTPAAKRLCSFGGVATGTSWDLCRSLAYGFEVQYPAAGRLIDNTATTARVDLPYVPDTNLTEKYLQITARENVSDCASPLAEGHAPGTIPTEPVQFNGLTFSKQSGQGAATGNRYDWVSYSINNHGACISLDFVLHSFVPELQPTPPPQYNQQAESAIFSEIMNTFAWLNSNGASTPPATQPTPAPQRIRFATGATSATVSGHLPAAGSDLYVLSALQGQNMTVDLSFTQGQAILVVWGADGSVLQSDHAEASHFQGILPSSQDYTIQVKGRPDGETDYSLQVTIPPLEAIAPTSIPTLIEFAPGTTSATVSGHLDASAAHLYKVYAQQGQSLQLDLTFRQGQALLVVWGEDGTVLQTDHVEVTSLERKLPSSQDYFIKVRGYPDGPTDYSLQVTIPPA